MTHGVLVVDKPAGPTSHDVVDRVRKALGERRAGHTGTLDPFATGVLPVCLGKATRLVRFLSAGEKAYLATVRLGFATTTDDRLGEPLGPAREVAVEPGQVEAACAALTGELMQVPPKYSAKRVGGRRMYDLAREGVAPEPAPAAVTVYAIAVLRVQGALVDLDVRCSPGTYVRSLARDLGARLGTGGHLDSLRRTRTGGFGLQDAVGWDDDPERWRTAVRPLSALLGELPAVTLDAGGAAGLRHGRPVGRAQTVSGFPAADPPPRVRLLDAEGRLLALAVPRDFGAGGSGGQPNLQPDIVLVD